MVFAKSKPKETLLEHTESVVKEAEELKRCYGKKILERCISSKYKDYFWPALNLVCKVHDMGKVQTLFQNKILKACHELEIPGPLNNSLIDIPHNIISPAFLNKELLSPFPKDLHPAIFQTIGLHHSRGTEYLQSNETWETVKRVILTDVTPRINELDDVNKGLFNNRLAEPNYNYRKKIRDPFRRLSGDELDFYMMLKGCLHRADHSGSSHMPIEVTMDNTISPADNLTDFLINEGRQSNERNNREIWQRPLAMTLSGNNTVLQAGTGSGKTAFALSWLGTDKAFYTLPMKTSVNSMYERIKEIYQNSGTKRIVGKVTKSDRDHDIVGLLHGDAAFYALTRAATPGGDDEEDESTSLRETIQTLDISRQLSMPVSICTADQLFTAAFRYPGYEKIFATLAYSRLIIDEIQSYNPDMVAVILKTLTDLSRIGCKFCVITATLPKMYLDYLKEHIYPEIEVPSPRFSETPRHRIKVLKGSIDDEVFNQIDKIEQERRNSSILSILIIANTVKMAKKLYKDLLAREKHIHKANLLHSMFTYEDRNFKENDPKNGILHTYRQNKIWITTQMAEVSLNVDFDILMTEISTIDSQVQRWGRVWRNREGMPYTSQTPNIYIAAADPPSDKGFIYDTSVVNLTRQKLAEKVGKSSSALLSDLEEYYLVRSVFDEESKRTNSKYMKKFEKSLDILRIIEDANFTVNSKAEAQKLFRNISSIPVLPSSVYQQNQQEIDEALVNIESDKNNKNEDNDPLKKRISRLRSLLIIKNKSVPIPFYYLEKTTRRYLNRDYGIIVANIDYNSELGAEISAVV